MSDLGPGFVEVPFAGEEPAPVPLSSVVAPRRRPGARTRGELRAENGELRHRLARLEERVAQLEEHS